MTDPIVEEVRQFRDEHARKFDYDLDAICADFIARQGKSQHRLVRLPAKPISNKKVHLTVHPSA